MSEEKGQCATSPAMILAAVVGVFAVPVLAIVMIVQLVLAFQAGHVDKNDPRMSAAAVQDRIKPYGEVKAIDPSAPHVDKTGEAVYTEVCSACHATGALNAPKFGDKAAWGARNAQGFDTLVKHAISGIRAMPARGGNPELSDIEMARAVAHMANSAGANFKPK
jgi:cytochrome c5